MSKERCAWVSEEDIYIAYHDKEWGNPVFGDDRYLFEMLTLEGAQAGLSWITILKRRENYRRAFDNFEVDVIAAYPDDKVEALMEDEGIIRNRRKIESVIKNANAFQQVQEEFGSFDQYIWGFVDRKPIVNHWEKHEEVPAQTELSKQISKDLKKRGFSFVGPVICYSFMQATGMVNDHTTNCFLSENK
ncbi:DNA-3-methyladenine glycosylase I [Oceanobacillus neutriphilus]|uniref:DNA-3-methyladenine glycosylase n=1 Tax=Oceanobacillus neutriphilus TaxID=531815 RepID=A0ABQ2P0Q5_9BACI|nr:DNA-3-methyladenine glycosylase I [Oceanobacillus neutriphilus]GGP14973.1 DNA-3-methyladenine glycosylase [Oceanobacillus neutriphilus]